MHCSDGFAARQTTEGHTRLWEGTLPLLHMGFPGKNVLSTMLWDYSHTDDKTRDVLDSRHYSIPFSLMRTAAERKLEGDLR